MNEKLSRALLAVLLTTGLSTTALASEIKVTTDPAGASVQLDGVSHGPSPVTIKHVTRGSHTLKVSMEGWMTREDVLDVDGESDFQVHAPLNPAPKIPPPEPPKPAPTPPAPEPKKATPPPAAPPPPPPPLPPPPTVENRPVGDPPARKSLILLVETVPDHAFVQIVGMDDNRRAPATFTGFSPGTIQLLVRAPGYKDKKVEVDLQHDARTRVKLDPL